MAIGERQECIIYQILMLWWWLPVQRLVVADAEYIKSLFGNFLSNMNIIVSCKLK